MKKFYLLLTVCVFGFMSTFAQTIDATGTYTPVIGDGEVVYVEFSFVDGNANGIYDCAIAFLDGPMSTYGDYSAVIVMYDASKFGFKFRNAGTFASDVEVIPVPGQVYKMWVTFNITNQTYSVDYLTTGMTTHARIATDYGFRKNPIANISTWAAYHNPSAEAEDIATVLKTGKVAKVGDVLTSVKDLKGAGKLQIKMYEKAFAVIGVDAFEVYNTNGMKVAEVTNNNAGIKTSLNSGIYIVKSGSAIQKIVIQ